MPQRTEDQVMEYREKFRSKLNSFQDSNAKLDFIAAFQGMIMDIKDEDPLKKAWNEEIAAYMAPRQADGNLDKEKLEQRFHEFADWHMQKMVETGEIVQEIPEEHTAEWITDHISTTKQSILYSNFRQNILFGIGTNIPNIDSDLVKAYPQYQLGEMSYGAFVARRVDELKEEVDTDTLQVIKLGEAYISDNHAENLVNEPILQAKTPEEKEAAVKNREQWKERQKELQKEETRFSEQILQSQQMSVSKEMWDPMDLSFLGDAAAAEKLRKEQERCLEQFGMKTANYDYIEMIERTQELFDEQKPGRTEEYRNMRAAVQNLKDTLMKYGSAPEGEFEILKAKSEFMNSSETYMGSLPEKSRSEIQNSSLRQLIEETSSVNMKPEKAFQAGLDSFRKLYQELQEKSGKRKGFFGGEKENSEEFEAVLQAVTRMKNGLQEGNVQSGQFNNLSNRIKDACETYLRSKGPGEGKERYALVQNLWNANQRIRNQYQPEFTEMKNKLDKDSPEIQQFKEDIRKKLDSFENPMDKMEFMASFQRVVLGIGDDGPICDAWSEVALESFQPRLPDGSLDKKEFEKRLDEANQWIAKKTLEVGKIVEPMQQFQSAEWLTKKVFASKPSLLASAIKDALLRGSVFMDQDTQVLFAKAYDGEEIGTFYGNRYKKTIVNQIHEKNPEIDKTFTAGRVFIFGNQVKDTFDERIEDAGTEKEKKDLEEEKKQWKEQQTQLQKKEKLPSADEQQIQEMNTEKAIWDSLDLSFISNSAIVQSLRKEMDHALEEVNLKGANSDFIEQVNRTEKLLDGMEKEKRTGNSQEYRNLREKMGKAKETLYRCGTAPEHKSEVRQAQKALADSCKAYMDVYAKEHPKEKFCRPVAQMMEAVEENYKMGQESAWRSSVNNFNVNAKVLQENSGQRKGTLWGKKEDSEEYRKVLESVNAMQNNMKQGPLKAADFRTLNDRIKEACDHYLEVKHPRTVEGMKRYELIQNIWNASSRLSNHYKDNATKNPYSLSSDLEVIRKAGREQSLPSAEGPRQIREAAKQQDLSVSQAPSRSASVMGK